MRLKPGSFGGQHDNNPPARQFPVSCPYVPLSLALFIGNSESDLVALLKDLVVAVVARYLAVWATNEVCRAGRRSIASLSLCNCAHF